MMLYATVTDLVKAVNLWNDNYSLGLCAWGATDNQAAWGAGNCRVTIEQRPPMQGKPLAWVESVNYNAEHEPPNAEAQAVWQELTALLKGHFTELPKKDYPRGVYKGESSRIANTSLEKMHAKQAWLAELREREPNLTKDDIDAQWAQRPKRPKLTAKQAAAEFFANLAPTDTAQPTPSAAPDAPALPTSGAGDGQAEPSAKSKRGPRYYSKAEKVKAVKEWADLDKDTNPIRLEDWLDEKFGNENGVLNVKPSTFHGWRKLTKHVDTP